MKFLECLAVVGALAKSALAITNNQPGAKNKQKLHTVLLVIPRPHYHRHEHQRRRKNQLSAISTILGRTFYNISQ